MDFIQSLKKPEAIIDSDNYSLLGDYVEACKDINEGTFNYNKNDDHLVVTIERLSLQIDELKLNGTPIHQHIKRIIQKS